MKCSWKPVTMMRIALAQINSTVGDIPGNCRKIEQYLERAQKVKADIVAFPELALCGYPPEDLLYKESFIQDNLKILRSLVKRVEDIVAIIGFVDQDQQGRLFNAAVVVENGRWKAVYHKQELPNYGVFDEKRYFLPGRENPLFLFNHSAVGVSICEDIWVKEGPCALQAQAGARILINISSSPFDFGKLEAREKLLMDRARRDQVHICYVNMVGGQDELVFDGGSFIVDSQGKIIASGKQFEEDLIVEDLLLRTTRINKNNKIKIIQFKEHSQPSQPKIESPLAPRLSQMERIFKALILGTRDYVQKNGFKKVVVGLSGGIDSSLVAAIAVEALGKENVYGISMPSQFTSAATREDARRLAKSLGIHFKEIPIQGVFAEYLSLLERHFEGLKRDATEENLQARIRGNLVMAFSNKFGWLVLTTGNKSEIAVGYCTLYGDMSGGFAVIKDLPKTKVYELARYINKIRHSLIPESVLTRAPTAELKKDQKDQDTLPPYDLLDAMIQAYVEDHASYASIKGRFNNSKMIQDVIRKIDRNEYKRRQAPPGIKITQRAFGKDWRLPITNKYKEF